MSSRLPLLTPADLTPTQHTVYEQIVGGPRASGPSLFALTNDDGSLAGPFNALLHAPDVGAALSRLGEAIRYHTSLSDRIREIAILAVAAHHRSDYEWYAHERVGRHVGLSEAEIQRIRVLAPIDGLAAGEQLAYTLCLEALRERDVAETTYLDAVQALGQTAVVELVSLLGYYEALALVLSVFRIPAPVEVEWPDPASVEVEWPDPASGG